MLTRDRVCVFCGKGDVLLEAAHIVDHHRARDDLLASLELLGVDDYRNAVALCHECHRFFDSHMMCIEPDSMSLLVCDAFLACSPYRDAYAPLNGRIIVPSSRWPPKEVLMDRYQIFLQMSNTRRENNKRNHFTRTSRHATRYYESPAKQSANTDVTEDEDDEGEVILDDGVYA